MVKRLGSLLWCSGGAVPISLISLRTTEDFGLGVIAEKKLVGESTVNTNALEHLLVSIFYLTEILTEAIFVQNALDWIAFVG